MRIDSATRRGVDTGSRKALDCGEPARSGSREPRQAARMAEKKDPGYSEDAREFLSKEIKHHKDKGMKQDQAVAAAMSEARKEGYKVPKED
jgi:hypothetical protein